MTSLIPMLYSNFWEDLNEPPSCIMDQNSCLGFSPQQIPIWSNHYWLSGYRNNERHFPLSTPYRKSWNNQFFNNGEGKSFDVKIDKDQFEVVIDVQQFKPDEINVKVINDCVIVQGKHEEKRDEHGWISRRFERRYSIPDQCNSDKITSRFSSDGILTITAPLKEQAKIKDERSIEIERSGKLAGENCPGQDQSGAGKTAVGEMKENINDK